MGRTLSEDLRSRFVGAVEGGLSSCTAAERFGVGVATAIRWVQVFYATRAKPKGGRTAIQADDDVVAAGRLRELEGRIRDMGRLLGRKTMKVEILREALSNSTTLQYLPPYSPNFNPIENAFAKLKAILSKAAARSPDDLWTAIGAALLQLTPAECANLFTAAGSEPE